MQLKDINSGPQGSMLVQTGALSAIYRRSFSCPGYHNRNLCGRYSYPGSPQKS